MSGAADRTGECISLWSDSVRRCGGVMSFLNHPAPACCVDVSTRSLCQMLRPVRHCTQITSESCAEQIQICKAAEGSDAGIAD